VSEHELEPALRASQAETRRLELNVAEFLARQACERPDAPALHAARAFRGGRTQWDTISWLELDRRATALARGLSAQGLARGDRAGVFVRPGADLLAIVFALFKLGAVPVLLDPGLGARALVASLARMEPRAFLGVPVAHVLRVVHSRALSSIRIAVTVGGRWFPRTVPLDELARTSEGPDPTVAVAPDDEAAILFTSGSTGPAKGVVVTHGMIAAQVEALRALYGFQPGETDLACFPLFALLDAAFGMTSVFPLMDVARPGRCDPARIAEALEQFRCTSSFGSPAIWRRVAPWCRARGVFFPELRRVIVAGAPVPPELVEQLGAILDERGDVFTPYGATEGLPVTSIRGREILAARERMERGHGTCVGLPAPGVDVRVVTPRDEPIERWDEALCSPPFVLGEVCVRGPNITRRYARENEATRAAKIEEGEQVWHRMGDLGYLDDDGRLWFCGRKAHRLETPQGLIAPVPTENVVETHARVRRAALVGIGARGAQRAVLIVEPKRGEFPRSKAARAEFERSVLEHLAARRAPAPIAAPASIERVLFHPRFPLDARHNAKKKSELLQRWAAARCK